MSCFESCACRCSDGTASSEFDRILTAETRLDLKLHDLCHSNVGWFQDRTLCDHHLDEWPLAGKSGVYLLWHKDDYCAAHENYHMRCLYVGKGNIARRFISHYMMKNFSEELLVYWSFYPLVNRLAKYVEQLLLDTFNVPLNKSENPGTGKLCASYSQDEVDFGS